MANQADRLVVGKYRKKAAVIPSCVCYTELQHHEGGTREAKRGDGCCLHLRCFSSPTMTGYLLLINITWSTISAMITTWRQLETIQPQSSRL